MEQAARTDPFDMETNPASFASLAAAAEETDAAFAEYNSAQNPKRQKKRKTFDLTFGKILYKPGSTSAERKAAWEHKNKKTAQDSDKGPLVYPNSWFFFNQWLNNPIQLYARQVETLVRALPEAYDALQQGKVGWQCMVAEGKTQRAYLVVECYKDELYLFLSKDYKRHENDTEWISMPSSNVSFHPEKDDQDDIMDFILDSSLAF